RRPGGTSTAAVTAVTFRRVPGQMVATLPGTLGARHLAPAEEASQDALVKARQVWPHEGVPSNPTAWLVQVAKNRALDLLRRDQRLIDLDALDTSRAESPHLAADAPVAASSAFDPAAFARLRGEAGAPEDDELAMMFLACHPMLSREARVALTLKTVCGFGVREIARAFLSREEAIAQRLVRAKRQLRDADVAFELTGTDYPARLESVLDVLYLLFNE